MMRRDLLWLRPLALLLMTLAFWLSSRTKRGVILPAMSVGAALVWTLGALVLLGRTITLGTFVLPALLLVVGSAYVIHVMARYYEQAEHSREPATVVGAALEHVWTPLCISALTTVIGFGSLMVSPIPAIFDLGLFAVIGVVALAFSALTVLPAMLALLPVERAAMRASDNTPLLDGMFARLADWASTSRYAILGAGALVALACLLGIGRIEADSDFMEYFDPASRVRRDNETINREIVGSNPFYVVIDGAAPGTMARWDVLRLVKDLQRFLETLPGSRRRCRWSITPSCWRRGCLRGSEGPGDDQGNIKSAEVPKSFWRCRATSPLHRHGEEEPAMFSGVAGLPARQHPARTRLAARAP
jgi:predicted RND superfamily exporter protein